METKLKEKVQRGLNAQFSPERVSAILNQAHAAYHYRNPHASNSPEVYELFESGFVDEALETLGFGRWAIGRPKLGNGTTDYKPDRDLATFDTIPPKTGER